MAEHAAMNPPYPSLFKGGDLTERLAETPHHFSLTLTGRPGRSSSGFSGRASTRKTSFPRSSSE
jgi:hypothetical protein